MVGARAARGLSSMRTQGGPKSVTREMTAAKPNTYLRGLGSQERFFWRYAQRNPGHFVLAAEFDLNLDARRVRDALDAVQRRHTLLSAHVEDDPELRLGFYRNDTVAPITLTCHLDLTEDWQVIAADELTRPLDRSAAPFVRAALLTKGEQSTLLLTFDHVIADGISALLVLNDLLVALNGQALAPLELPISVEDLVSRRLGPPQGTVSLEAGDPRIAAPTSFRPFDATPQHLHRVQMSRAETERLIARCRAEGTTVHAAIVVAASVVRSAESAEEFVRTYSPINVRDFLGQRAGSCVCIGGALTGMTPGDGTPFWSQARQVSNQLNAARSAAGLAAGSAIAEQLLPIDADCDAAEHFFRTVLPFELAITNLGVQDFPRIGPVRPRAVWGPMVLTQVEREYVTGIVTYGGQLRMVTCGHSPTAGFLERVREMLLGIGS